jgi:hypothetical protein
MFLVGLELDTSCIRQRAHATVAISHASIIFPFLLGSTMVLWLYPILSSSDVPFTTFALFLGVSLSVTAFPVLARILTDRGMHEIHIQRRKAAFVRRVGSRAVACVSRVPTDPVTPPLPRSPELTFRERVVARGEGRQHLPYGSPDRPIVDPMGIDLRLGGPVPHLSGRRPIERVDDHLAHDERIWLARDDAVVRRRLTFERSGRKANPEIWRRACLPVTFVRERRRNQVVHALLQFEGAG